MCTECKNHYNFMVYCPSAMYSDTAVELVMDNLVILYKHCYYCAIDTTTTVLTVVELL